MHTSLKKLAVWSLIVLGCLVALAFVGYIISRLGTAGLEYTSNGDGTCYVSGVGSAKDENVVIPLISPYGDRVTAIGDSAFEGYDKLKTIKLHGAIESIGMDAFYACEELVYTKYDNAYYIGNNENPYLILYKASSKLIESCEIHPDTEIIYGSAFSGCDRLQDIAIPDGVRSIGEYAFAWCTGLSKITFADSLRVIGGYAFLDCQSLGEITLPKTVERLEDWAFAFCDGLESIELLKGNRLISIGDYAFYGCEVLLSFDLGALSHIRSIGYASFAGCSKLEAVTAPRHKIKIGELAFLDCNIDDLTDIMEKAKKQKETRYRNDLPRNIGELNMILKAKQIKNIGYYTQESIPQQTGDYGAHQMHYGLPYSSTRIENLFVPNFVSFYSFITAAMNPYSYLYTVDLGDLDNMNGHTYYGAVCSTYCNYALGIEGMYTTYQWTEIPDMQVLTEQSVQAMQLGDTMVGEGHVLIVTGITRDSSGAVYEITIMDMWSTGPRERTLSAEKFDEVYSTDLYTYCRYGKLDMSEYRTEPYVLVYDKTPKTFNLCLDIITRKGDKSNWLVGMDVELDVVNAEGYNTVEIYKDGTLFEIRNIEDVVSLSGLSQGSYRARLVGEDKVSEPCYWMVVDSVSNAKTTGEKGQVRVTFSATNATPKFIVWQSAGSNGSKHCQPLTAEELSAGEAIGQYISGEYKVRVAFETEYGIIFSQLPRGITIP